MEKEVAGGAQSNRQIGCQAAALLPFSGGADQPVSHQTEPEVDDHAHVELEWPMARQGQGRGQEKIDNIAEDDGAERLNQIDQHNYLDNAAAKLVARGQETKWQLAGLHLQNGRKLA